MWSFLDSFVRKGYKASCLPLRTLFDLIAYSRDSNYNVWSWKADYLIVDLRFAVRPPITTAFYPSDTFEEPSFVKLPDLQLVTILSQPLEQNAYVAQLRDRSDCVVIDPGLEWEKIVRHLEKAKLTPAAILNTHGHSDHIGGNGAIKKRWPHSRWSSARRTPRN